MKEYVDKRMYILKAKFSNDCDENFSILRRLMGKNPDMCTLGDTTFDSDFLGIVYDSHIEREKFVILFDVYTKYIHTKDGTTFSSIVEGWNYSFLKVYEIHDEYKELMRGIIMSLESVKSRYQNDLITMKSMYNSFLEDIITDSGVDGTNRICKEYSDMKSIIQRLPSCGREMVFNTTLKKTFMYRPSREDTSVCCINIFDDLSNVMKLESNIHSDFLFRIIDKDNIDIVGHSISLINMKRILLETICQENKTLKFSSLISNLNCCLEAFNIETIDDDIESSSMVNIFIPHEHDLIYNTERGYSIRIPKDASNISFLDKGLCRDILSYLKDRDDYSELKMKLADYLSHR